jgi:hypothetical protein
MLFGVLYYSAKMHVKLLFLEVFRKKMAVIFIPSKYLNFQIVN